MLKNKKKFLKKCLVSLLDQKHFRPSSYMYCILYRLVKHTYIEVINNTSDFMKQITTSYSLLQFNQNMFITLNIIAEIFI